MKNIIIIGSRGYQSNYGGWETFVTNLIDNYDDKDTKFYVPELTNEKNDTEEIRNGVVCKKIYVPKQGFVTMFTFVIKAVNYYTKLIKQQKMENVVMYILGCRVGPKFTLIHKKLNKMGVKIIINPDGLEWKREKWSWWIKQCFKVSERTMIKSSNYVVCDSKAIKKYVDNKYINYHKETTFIPYGAYFKEIIKSNDKTKKFMKEWNIKENNYYLVVGRFVPENNLETILKGFIQSDSKKDLVIITNYEKDKFYNHLIECTHFDQDKRVKLVGPMYDQEILSDLRKFTCGYIHGHSAGGTNPSLLEALSITDINILYDVAYNKEVGEDACFYFTKENKSLTNILKKVEKLNDKEIEEYGNKCKKRIKEDYTWKIIVNKYKDLFAYLCNKHKI